jgi:uncharacterized membrane protein YgdD (TMEM256/DUF423 family)
MKTNQLIGLGCLMIATTVALGAMGAHTLEGSISPRYLEVWKTASLYFALNGDWVYSPLQTSPQQ